MKMSEEFNPQNKLLLDALVTRMTAMMREETQAIHEKIEKLEHIQQNGVVINNGGHRRDDNRLSGIKIKVPSFIGKSDPEAYLE